MAIETSTGLSQSAERRYHFDVYALVEGTQELYFGHETQVNVNMVETVKVPQPNGAEPLLKCYMSPTKRRGVERRSLIWSPTSDGRLLGDKLGCGIPHTCTQDGCPICAVYGGLLTSDADVDKGVPGGPKRKATTFIGRLVHGGGVAIQDLPPEEKQRAMHPAMLRRVPSADPKPDTPTPFRREYNEPGIIYPVYNHAMSVSESEFAAAAYAFMESLARMGASNPKGVRLFETDWIDGMQPLIVVDQYLVPLGNRPILSPAETDQTTALEAFCTAAQMVDGDQLTGSTYSKQQDEVVLFNRWLGSAALQKLRALALNFATQHLI